MHAQQHPPTAVETPGREWLLDAGQGPGLRALNGAVWAVDTDALRGGVSRAELRRGVHGGRSCLCFSGQVRLQGGGGFVRMVLNLAPGFDAVDASGYAGLRVTIAGDGQPYAVELQTGETIHSWQCYRASFVALDGWRTLDFPFAVFEPFRVMAPLGLSRLRRLNIVATGRPMAVRLYVGRVGFYRLGA